MRGDGDVLGNDPVFDQIIVGQDDGISPTDFLMAAIAGFDGEYFQAVLGVHCDSLDSHLAALAGQEAADLVDVAGGQVVEVHASYVIGFIQVSTAGFMDLYILYWRVRCYSVL